MADIAQFLAARLDEDERAAHAAQLRRPTPWQQRPAEGGALPNGVWVDDAFDDGVAVANGSYVADHILRHDPARVLADVAAKRRILARHCTAGTTRACDGCGWDREDNHNVEDIDDCPELRDLAAPYAEHPDYDPAWRVQ